MIVFQVSRRQERRDLKREDKMFWRGEKDGDREIAG